MGSTKHMFQPGHFNSLCCPTGCAGSVWWNIPKVIYWFLVRSMLFIVVLFPSKLAAQGKPAEDPRLKLNTLYMQASYFSKTGTFGTFESEVDQPSISGTITYTTPFNLDLNFQQYAIKNSDDSLKEVTYETDISIGYKQYFGKKIYAYGTYMHSFYSSNSSGIRSQFTDQAGIEAGFEGRYLNPSVSGIVMFGAEPEILLDLQHIFQFDLFTSRSGNTSLSVLPAADLMMGRLQFYNDYLLQQYRNHPWRFIYYYHVRQNMSRAEIEDMLETEKKFAVSSLNLSLPVTMTAGNWILTVSANFLKPFNQPEILGNDWIFYFTGSAGYMLSW
ncbi:MAG: hypothetical protein U0T82_15520 [Bacteroidales bacterium]